jgi:hypothetical protein
MFHFQAIQRVTPLRCNALRMCWRLPPPGNGTRVSSTGMDTRCKKFGVTSAPESHSISIHFLTTQKVLPCISSAYPVTMASGRAAGFSCYRNRNVSSLHLLRSSRSAVGVYLTRKEVAVGRTFLRSELELLVTTNVVPSSLFLFTLMMVAINSFKQLVLTRATLPSHIRRQHSLYDRSKKCGDVFPF